MAGKFCKIVAATGYLKGYATIVAATAVLAEREADAVVDNFLDGFDVDLWSAATTPQDVAQHAQKLAEGRYLRLFAAGINSVRTHDSEGGESLPGMLEREAREALGAIQSRGWYRADDGSRVVRREPERSGWERDLVR